MFTAFVDLFERQNELGVGFTATSEPELEPCIRFKAFGFKTRSQNGTGHRATLSRDVALSANGVQAMRGG